MYHSPHYISNMSSEFEEEGVGGISKGQQKVFDKVNSSPHAGQNDRHFAGGVFKCIFMNEKFCILIWIFTEFCSWGSDWQFSSIGSGHGLWRKATSQPTLNNFIDAYMRH